MTLFAALAIPVKILAQQYTITDLGTLGGTFSGAVGINNRGLVSGDSTLPGDMVIHGFFWEKGVMADLGTLGGPNSNAPEAWPPNNRGDVAGFSDTLIPDPNAENFCFILGDFPNPYTCVPVVWRDGVITPLPTLGGNNGSALAINNRGDLAGVAETDIPDPTCVPPFVLHFEPVIWRDGQPQRLPTVHGDPDGLIQGINDRGQAVGFTGSCSPVHAVLWDRGKAIDLGTLGGAVFNIAFSINNRGQVVGESDVPGDVTNHAFLWQSGVMTDLGTLPGDFTSIALSINNRTQIVGLSFDANGNVSPVLWQNGVIAGLNNLIPADSPLFLLEALGINDLGQIVGYGIQTASGEVHAYIAAPNSGSNSAARAVPVRERPRIVLPKNVRKMLEQQLRSRYHIRGLGAPRD
jgi:probable HAF family extracellular repeat protein